MKLLGPRTLTRPLQEMWTLVRSGRQGAAGSAWPSGSSLSLYLLPSPSGSSPWRPLPSVLPTSAAQTPGPHKADQQSGPAVHRSPAGGPPPPATSPGEKRRNYWGRSCGADLPLCPTHPKPSPSSCRPWLPPSRLPPLIRAPPVSPGSLWLLGTHSCSCFPTKAHFPCPTSPPLLGSALIARHPQTLQAPSPFSEPPSSPGTAFTSVARHPQSSPTPGVPTTPLLGTSPGC